MIFPSIWRIKPQADGGSNFNNHLLQNVVFHLFDQEQLIEALPPSATQTPKLQLLPPRRSVLSALEVW